MREETRALVRAMESWPWFEHVGEPIEDSGVIAVGSWDQAVERYRRYVWECLTLQVNNRTITELLKRDWHRAQSWNPITVEVDLALRPLLDRVRALGARLALPEKAFYHQVQWDLVGICTETEYADIEPPPFNVPVVAPWYRAGHFPCGWDGPELDTYWNGEFPPYRLYVF